MASASRSPLRSFIAARLTSGIVSIVGVSLIVFLGTALLPGDAASTLLGQNATPATVEALRRELGLDQPLYLRYLQWVGAALTGDFGASLSSGQPVMDLILPRLANSLILAGAAAAIVLPLAVGAGIVAAIRRDTPLDAVLGGASLVLVSMPTFMVGYRQGLGVLRSPFMAMAQQPYRSDIGCAVPQGNHACHQSRVRSSGALERPW